MIAIDALELMMSRPPRFKVTVTEATAEKRLENAWSLHLRRMGRSNWCSLEEVGAVKESPQDSSSFDLGRRSPPAWEMKGGGAWR